MARYQSSRRKESPKPSLNPSSDFLRSRPFAPESQDQVAAAHPATESQSLKFPNLVSFNRPQPIQPKLTIGAPNDRYEQEADRVANQVVQHINAPTIGPANPSQSLQREDLPDDDELQMKPMLQREVDLPDDDELQMKSALSAGVVEGDASPDLESAIQHARGSGQALTPDLQTKMGQAMGADFSQVRVHTDSQSDQLNRSIQAKAFTTGQDIFFRQGAYQPENRGGQELIAHELTHVVQQGCESKGSSSLDRKKENVNVQRMIDGKGLTALSDFKKMRFYGVLDDNQKSLFEAYLRRSENWKLGFFLENLKLNINNPREIIEEKVDNPLVSGEAKGDDSKKNNSDENSAKNHAEEKSPALEVPAEIDKTITNTTENQASETIEPVIAVPNRELSLANYNRRIDICARAVIREINLREEGKADSYGTVNVTDEWTGYRSAEKTKKEYHNDIIEKVKETYPQSNDSERPYYNWVYKQGWASNFTKKGKKDKDLKASYNIHFSH